MLPYFSYKTSLRWQHLIIKHSRCDTIPENKNLLPFRFFKGKNCHNYQFRPIQAWKWKPKINIKAFLYIFIALRIHKIRMSESHEEFYIIAVQVTDSCTSMQQIKVNRANTHKLADIRQGWHQAPLSCRHAVIK